MNFQPYEYARNFKTVKGIFYLLQKYIFGEDKRISKTWKENKIFVILKSAKKWKNNPPKFRFSQGLCTDVKVLQEKIWYTHRSGAITLLASFTFSFKSDFPDGPFIIQKFLGCSFKCTTENCQVHIHSIYKESHSS